MNILLIVVIAILAIGLIVGGVRGFTDMLFETATTLVAIILASLLCSPIANAVIKNEDFMTKIENKVTDVMKLDELAAKTPSAEELFKNMNLPSVITDGIAKSIDSQTGVTVKAAAEATSAFIARMIVYVACFIVLVILAIIVLHLLDHIFDLLNKLPVLKELNALAGAVVGLVLALLAVWIFFAIVTLLSSSSFGMSMMEQIAASNFLSFLYNNNIPMQIITNKVGNLLG